MRIERVAVVVPGIMGSALFFKDAAGGPYEIWGENLYTNYKRFLDSPSQLCWTGKVAEARLLESVYFSHSIAFRKLHLWEDLLAYLSKHPEFGRQGRTLKIGYDWRRSLLDTASDVGKEIEARLSVLSHKDSVKRSDLRLVLITHSMGGLVIRLALALGAIAPDHVDRILHIGSPLGGAPQAFCSIYKSGSLPLLRELTGLVHRKNSSRFFNHMLDAFRTFPSVYQLMPPKSNPFLYYSSSDRRSPFGERWIPEEYRKLAEAAHQKLLEADRLIVTSGLKVFCICTQTHSQRKTDLEYRVQPLPPPAEGYRIEEIIASTDHGDGTVPYESASGNPASCKAIPVLNVTHSKMCNESRVTSLMPNLL